MANLSHNDLYTEYYTSIINSRNKATIKQLLNKCSEVKYNNEIKTDSCPITLERFKENETLVKLPCNHIFSKSAINEWFKNKSSCPVCRTEIKVNENDIFKDIVDIAIESISEILEENDISELEQENIIFEIY